MPILWIVIPCLNEEAVLLETRRQLIQAFNQLISQGEISPDSRILFVNDGSKDKTWKMIQAFHKEDNHICGLDLSRNFGHQNALLAGMMTAKEYADICITMDADLQDDVEKLDEFVKAYREGHDVVYGVRVNRKTDSFLKKHSAETFYRFMHFLGVELVFNHADYRLLSKRALVALSEYQETNLFLRGLIPMLGFDSTTIEYKRNRRFAGKTKYSIKKMFKFAFEGITSFSIRPIRMITVCGALFFIICILMIIYFLFQHFTGNTVSGWTSLIVSIWTLGSLQLVAIGIIGEYIGKNYLESKKRPKYTVKDVLIE